MVVLGHRPDQLGAVVACAGHELVCIHVAGVHQVLGGQQILGCQRAVYWRQRIAIHDRRGRRLDVGDKMRPFLVARLRQVHDPSAIDAIVFTMSVAFAWPAIAKPRRRCLRPS